MVSRRIAVRIFLCSILWLWLWPTQPTRGQSGNSSLDLGLMAGASGFTGDLNQSALPRRIGAHGAFFVRYQISEMYNARVAILGSSAHGAYDSSRYYLPAHDLGRLDRFTSIVLGVEASMEIHFMRFEVNDFCRQRHNSRGFTPYVTLGLGGGATMYLGEGGGMKGLFYIPMGAGVKFAVGRRLCIAPEVRFLKLFTDRVDGYSGWPIGNDVGIHNRDWLSMVSLTLSYRLLTNVQRCPAYMR